ncbi:PD-(D/E)XK nuclease family protein [Candidatus Woesearchaeota archaeon]|nr:PD-(D/E)XK nuclease family protein [Candidatus Woesearchaeota archaeon]
MPYTLSPHALNLSAECPRCFWEEVQGNKRPSGPFPSLPSGMDKIIKQRFDTYRKMGSLPEELSKLEGLILFSDEKLLRKWRDHRKGLQWADEQGNILAGSLDEVLQTPSGELIVLDYKTRGFPLKKAPDYYTLQLECYTLLLQKKGFLTTDYAFLLFYYPERFTPDSQVTFNHQLVEIPVSPAHAEETFSKAVSVLEGEKPAVSQECSFCSWRGS